MSREVVSLQYGQCGNNMGHTFWQVIADEHDVNEVGVFTGEDSEKMLRLPVFFNESSTGRFVPRVVLADTEHGSLNQIRTTEWGALYHPESFIFGSGGAGNNFARGYKGEGAILAEFLKDKVRKYAETCECLVGFQHFHSLGGGTGSGLGTLMLQDLKQEFPHHQQTTYSLYPSPVVSDVTVEPYNAILAHSKLIENSDFTVVFANEALFRIVSEKLLTSSPTYQMMNRLIGNLVAGATSSMRFPGWLNCDMRKLTCNLVPFPRVHFCSGSFAPIISSAANDYTDHSVSFLTQQAFDTNNVMSSYQAIPKFFCCQITYRGSNILSKHVEDQTFRIQAQYSNSFIKYMPNSIKTSIVKVSQKGFRKSATMFANNISVVNVFKKTQKNFEIMFKKNAFLHWYEDAGIEEQDFTEASANTQDLNGQYELYFEDAEDENDDE